MLLPCPPVRNPTVSLRPTSPSAVSTALLGLVELAASSDGHASCVTWLRHVSTQVGAHHAYLGWYEHGHSVVQAQWHHPDWMGTPVAPPEALIEAAMDEAQDQGVTVYWPEHSPEQQQQRGVTLAQRTLAQRWPAHVMSLPLPGDEHPSGSITLVWPETAPVINAQAPLEILVAQCAPILQLQRLALRPWHWHARQAWTRRWHQLTDRHHPRHQRWMLALCVGAMALILWPLPDRVSGRARIEGSEQRVLAAPSDGFIKATHVHPGDRVKAGQVLADLAEQDLQLEHDKWASQMAQHENSYAGAMTRADRAEAALNLAKVQEAQAQMALVDEQLERSQLTAPFDGVVIQGDLSQSIGAPVRQGDALLTVASTARYRVVIDIDEGDVGRVRMGQSGTMALSALPWDTLDLRVIRITPLAQAREGRNGFEVHADFTEPLPSDLRPGLMGHAKITLGHGPWLWTAARPLIERLRLALWSWWG